MTPNEASSSNPVRPPDRWNTPPAEMLDRHPDAIIGVDTNWSISYTNVAATSILPQISNLLDERRPDGFQTAMRDRVPTEFDEFLSGSLNAWMRVSVHPISDGIVVFLHDVSLEKKAIDALTQGERLASLGRLISSIAHEIANPLEAVTNLLYLARMNPSSPNQSEHLSMAERELRRAGVIVSHALRFARQRTAPTRVCCGDLLREVLSLQRVQIEKAHIQVDASALSPAPVLCSDGEVRQILNNLIANAIEAMPTEDARLVLRTRTTARGSGGVIITIADNGAGMSDQTMAKLFTPFFSTKGESGNGLGLWISREIARRHGGTLKVRSGQQPGHLGSVFQLFLPSEPVCQ